MSGELKVHPCGYPVFVETIWNGIAWRPIFTDGDETSETAGQRVYDCPKCGEHILARDFETEKETPMT